MFTTQNFPKREYNQYELGARIQNFYERLEKFIFQLRNDLGRAEFSIAQKVKTNAVIDIAERNWVVYLDDEIDDILELKNQYFASLRI